VTSVRGGYGFQLKAPNSPLKRVGLQVLDPGPDEVVVEVAGCGVCHTDVAFATDGVPTRHPLPLILGHEISGRVVAAAISVTERAEVLVARIASGRQIRSSSAKSWRAPGVQLKEKFPAIAASAARREAPSCTSAIPGGTLPKRRLVPFGYRRALTGSLATGLTNA